MDSEEKDPPQTAAAPLSLQSHCVCSINIYWNNNHNIMCNLFSYVSICRCEDIMENRERPSSPDHSCVSLKSDASMKGHPPDLSDDPVASDPR